MTNNIAKDRQPHVPARNRFVNSGGPEHKTASAPPGIHAHGRRLADAKPETGGNMKSVAIITARGGSRRIPRKNIRDFCGRPILAYSIEAALKSGMFDRVMVSTDDEEIAETAKAHGEIGRAHV